MNLKEKVFEGLAPAGVPAWFGAYKATDEHPAPPPQYIVFTTMTIPGKYEDDALAEWRHFVYLEMWSAIPYETQKANIVALMAAAGFEVNELRDGYEADNGSSHLSATFIYSEEVG